MRLHILTAILLVLTVAPANGQNIHGIPADTVSSSLELDNVRKIAFSDGKMVATLSDGSTLSQKFSENDCLRFAVPEKHDDVSEPDDSRYTIYDLSGRPVKSHMNKELNEPFDLSDLTPGIYLLRTSNRTIKIVK